MHSAARRDAIASRACDPREARATLPRTCRLLRSADYAAVYNANMRRSNREFAVFLRANGLEISRFGWSVKKALGSAVQRNRIRRRLRDILRLHRREIAPGWDLVIHPRSSAGDAEFSVLTRVLLKLLPRREQDGRTQP